MVVTFSLTQAQLPPANGVCPVSPHGPLEATVTGEGTEPQAAVTSVIVLCLGTRPGVCSSAFGDSSMSLLCPEFPPSPNIRLLPSCAGAADRWSPCLPVFRFDLGFTVPPNMQWPELCPQMPHMDVIPAVRSHEWVRELQVWGPGDGSATPQKWAARFILVLQQPLNGRERHLVPGTGAAIWARCHHTPGMASCGGPLGDPTMGVG